MRTNQELEFTVCALEDEKRTLNLKLDETLHSLAERERQIQCLDTRLNERNHQVVCLQEDNAMKAQRLCALEKDLDVSLFKFILILFKKLLFIYLFFLICGIKTKCVKYFVT